MKLQLTLTPVLLFLLVGHSQAIDFFKDPPFVTLRDENLTGYNLARAYYAVQTVDGWTSLTLAVASGDLAKTGQFLHSREDANHKDRFGRSDLLIAALSNQAETAKRLVEAGADVNASSTKGLTPLLAAIDNSNEELALFLLNHGADPNLKLKNEQTAFMLASSKGLSRVTAALKSSDANAAKNASKPAEQISSPGQPKAPVATVRPFPKSGTIQQIEQVAPKDYRIESEKAEPDATDRLEKTKYLLSFSQCQNRISLDWEAPGFETGARKPEVRWLERDRLVQVSWRSYYTRAHSHVVHSLVLKISRSTLNPLLKAEIELSSRWDRAELAMCFEPDAQELRLTEYRFGVNNNRIPTLLSLPTIEREFLTTISPERIEPLSDYDDPPSYISYSRTKTIYRYTIGADEIRYVDGQTVELGLNGFPLVDIAEALDLSPTELRQMNPAQHDSLFCTGPLLTSTNVPENKSWRKLAHLAE